MAIHQNNQQEELQRRPQLGVAPTNNPGFASMPKSKQQCTMESTLSECKADIDKMIEKGWSYYDGIDKGGNEVILIFQK
jgi:hypothetical protein